MSGRYTTMVVIVMLATPATRQRHGIASRSRTAFAVVLRLQRSSSLPRNRLHRLGLRDVRDLNAHDAAVRQRHTVTSRSRTAFIVILRLPRSSSLPRNRLHRLGPRDGRGLHARDAALRQRQGTASRPRTAFAIIEPSALIIATGQSIESSRSSRWS